VANALAYYDMAIITAVNFFIEQAPGQLIYNYKKTYWLQDASFLGELLVLPANVRLDWKVIARYKHSSLFGLVFCSEEIFL
jgi:hypothetical protein